MALRHYPVAIIGSGPIGLTLANLLGTMGVGCLVVERNSTTVQELRAVSIDDKSLRTADGREVLLDAVLGNRFALLVRSEDPAAALARLRQTVWDRLGVARVALLPAGTPPRAAEGVVAAETDGALDAALAGYPGCALLLRPDHYVAAAVPLDDAEAAARAVEALLASTWEEAALAQAA